MGKVQEIPFRSLAHNRFVPWIVTLMCYLTLLVLGGATFLNSTISHFHKGLEKAVTVEMFFSHQGFLTPDEEKNQQKQEQNLVQILKKYSKTDRVDILNTGLLENFARPWKQAAQDPLFKKPLLIDVFPKAGQRIQKGDLENYLKRYLHGVTVYEVHPWKQELINLAWTLLFATLAMACLISFVAISIIIFTTHMGLSLHQRTVDILRLIGATNTFIAKRFQGYAVSLAFKGAWWGAFFAALTFFLFLGSSLFKTHLSLFLVLLITPFLLTLLTFIGAKASFSMTLNKERDYAHSI